MKSKLIVSVKVDGSTWTLRPFQLGSFLGQVATRTRGKDVLQLAWVETQDDGDQKYFARLGTKGPWKKVGRAYQGIPVADTFTALEAAADLC